MAETRTQHPYYMYDAIVAQPVLVERAFTAARMEAERSGDAATAKKRIIFVGIGTSLHAAQIAERFLRHLTAGKSPVLAEQSFEFVKYPLALGPADAVVVITHTGTTSYSVEALRMAKTAGALTIAVCGENSGEGMRVAHHLISTGCEQEVCFAYTKSYTTALAALALFARRVAHRRGLLADPGAAGALARLPGVMKEALRTEAQVREIAKAVAARPLLYFVAGGANWYTAQEAALKVKETCYIAAEGFESEQLLHGPFSEIDSRVSLVAFLTGGPADQRTRQILRAAGEVGVLRIAIAVPEASRDIAAEHVVEVPGIEEWLSPFVHLVPAQFLSYFVTLEKGINPDTGRQDQPAHAHAHSLYKL